MHCSDTDNQRIVILQLYFCIEKHPYKGFFMQFALTKICMIIVEYVSLSVNYT